MQTSVEEVNSVQRRVKVNVASEKVNAAFDNAYRDLQKKARVRGFRPGKAPIQMIKKMYGESVAADVADKLIRQHLFEAIEKNEIRPIASPALEQIDMPKPNEEYNFSAVVDVMPQLEIANYKGIKLVCHKTDVTDETVAKEVENLRKRHAKQKSVDADTVAAIGHNVTISHKAKIGNEPFAPLTVEGITIEIGAGQSIKEIDDALIGMKVGETKTFALPLSAEFPDASLAGKNADIELTLSALAELVLPVADDEFAKDLGFKSMEDCVKQVREGLIEQAAQMRKNELESNLMTAIVDANQFDVPPAMVAAVIDDMIEQMQWRNDTEKKQAKVDQEFRKSLIESAKKRARNTLILWEVAKRENIEVGPEDIDAHFRKMLRIQDNSEDLEANAESLKLLEKLKTTVGQNYLDNLRIEKTIARLIELSEIDEHAHSLEDHHKHV